MSDFPVDQARHRRPAEKRKEKMFLYVWQPVNNVY
jgi:hypothetical protein